jgi:hypothetical protein
MRPEPNRSVLGLYLQSLFELLRTAHWLRPRTPPPLPLHLGSYTRALLVSQDRRHLVPPFYFFIYT